MKLIALFCMSLLTAVNMAAETPPRVAMSDARSNPLLCAKFLASRSSQEFCCGLLFNAFARQSSDSGLFIKAADFGLAAAEISPNMDYGLLRVNDRSPLLETHQLAFQEVCASDTVRENRDMRFWSVAQNAARAGFLSLAEEAIDSIGGTLYRGKGLVVLASAYIREGMVDKAAICLNSAEEECSRSGKARDQTSCLTEAAEAYWSMDQRDAALRTLETAAAVGIADKGDYLTTKALGRIVEFCLKNGLLDQVGDIVSRSDVFFQPCCSLDTLFVRLIEQASEDDARRIASIIPAGLMKVCILRQVSDSLVMAGRIKAATRVLGQAEGTAEVIAEPDVKCRALAQVAVGYYNLQDSTRMTRLLRAAEQIALRIHGEIEDGIDPLREAMLGTVAESYLLVGFLEKGRELTSLLTDNLRRYWMLKEVATEVARSRRPDMAFEIANIVPEPEWRAKVILDLADFDSDHDLYDDAVTCAREIENPYGRASSSSTIADKMIDKGRMSQASDLLREVDSLTQLIGHSGSRYYMLLTLPDMYFRSGDTVGFRRTVERALACRVPSWHSDYDDGSTHKIVGLLIRARMYKEAFELVPDQMTSDCGAHSYMHLMGELARAGQWTVAIDLASTADRDEQRCLALVALACWYYILQPDSGDKQTDFLHRLIAASEK